jgi:hypothetical protein
VTSLGPDLRIIVRIIVLRLFWCFSIEWSQIVDFLISAGPEIIKILPNSLANVSFIEFLFIQIYFWAFGNLAFHCCIKDIDSRKIIQNLLGMPMSSAIPAINFKRNYIDGIIKQGLIILKNNTIMDIWEGIVVKIYSIWQHICGIFAFWFEWKGQKFWTTFTILIYNKRVNFLSL